MAGLGKAGRGNDGGLMGAVQRERRDTLRMAILSRQVEGGQRNGDKTGRGEG